MNNKKRSIVDREGLESDEGEVEDLQAMEHIEEILRTTYDPDLCRNTIEPTNNHEYKDAVEITLHFINIKELKFVYRHNRNKLARVLVAYI
jgi:hypothetical protein